MKLLQILLIFLLTAYVSSACKGRALFKDDCYDLELSEEEKNNGMVTCCFNSVLICCDPVNRSVYENLEDDNYDYIKCKEGLKFDQTCSGSAESKEYCHKIKLSELEKNDGA